MAELTAAQSNREAPLQAGRVRATRRMARHPDYDGVYTAEARTRAHTGFSVGDEAVPTDGAALTRTAPDCADMNKWFDGVRGYLTFDGGVGETATVTVWALNLMSTDANSVYVKVGEKDSIGHMEEFLCEDVGGRPVRFQITNATDDGDITFAPA